MLTIAANGVDDESAFRLPAAPKGGKNRFLLVQQFKNTHLKTDTQRSVWHLVLNLDILL
ncbi:conserved hypothetical protein [Pantoea brenneri]|uniref:Transposase n=1 Tax=Pantoea brenneri TaxID=472694 RepID=A0AAX3J722_9GAMM|nr:conserved hypothetical protein [Pantoea brenneri]